MAAVAQLYGAPANPARALAAALCNSLKLTTTPTLLPSAEPGAWTVLFDSERDAAAALAAPDPRLWGRAVRLQKAGPRGGDGSHRDCRDADRGHQLWSAISTVVSDSDSSIDSSGSDQEAEPEATATARHPPEAWLMQRRAEAQLKEMLGPALYQAFTSEGEEGVQKEEDPGGQLAVELASLALGSSAKVDTLRVAALDALGGEGGGGGSCPGCAENPQPTEPNEPQSAEPEPQPEQEGELKPFQRQLLELDDDEAEAARRRKQERRQQLRRKECKGDQAVPR